MGIYYYLLNDSKRESIHLDGHVKFGPMTENAAVHYALFIYMFQNKGDLFRITSDMYDDYLEYVEIDLLRYNFLDDQVKPNIVRMLNEVYKTEKYIIKEDGNIVESTEFAHEK